MVAAVPPAVGVAAVVVAAAAPAAEAAVGAVDVATPCNGHTRYLGHHERVSNSTSSAVLPPLMC